MAPESEVEADLGLFFFGVAADTNGYISSNVMGLFPFIVAGRQLVWHGTSVDVRIGVGAKNSPAASKAALQASKSFIVIVSIPLGISLLIVISKKRPGLC